VSQTFQITWVGQNPPREYSYNGKNYKEYTVSVDGYSGAKSVKTSYFADEDGPAPGDEVFGHIEAKEVTRKDGTPVLNDDGTPWVKHTLRRERAQGAGPPANFKKATDGTTTDVYSIEQDNRGDRISYQGLLQACIIRGDDDPTVAAKKYFDLVRNFTPDAPEKTPTTGDAGPQEPPKYEDVTPKAALADDDSVPF
jgi:hypothetical protein